jgi:hypothetical protein
VMRGYRTLRGNARERVVKSARVVSTPQPC